MMSRVGMPMTEPAASVDDRRPAAADRDVVFHVGDAEVAVRFRAGDPASTPTSAGAARLAEGLVADRLSLEPRRIRVASLVPSGRPVAFASGLPAAVSLSISHVPGLVAAAVSTGARVGVDIVDPAEAGRGLDVWFTPDELALAPDDGSLRAVLWAAKEAAYKACRLDTEFRPRAVVVDSLDGRSFGWIVHDRFGDVRGTGRLLTIGRHVVAMAIAAADRDPWTGAEGRHPAGDRIAPDGSCFEIPEALFS